MEKKVVFITGASRGIGRALAEKFLEEDYFVIGTSTSGRALFKHENLIFLKLDLASSKSISACVNDFIKLKKKIDLLINNAGMVVEEEVDSNNLKTDYLRRTLEVNLIGTIDFTEKLISSINKGGQIVNISSKSGSLGSEAYTLNYPSYRISKVALNMFTKVLANRLKDSIKVSSIHPGSVKTDMNPEALMSTKESAGDIYKRIISLKETGQFWYKQEKYPW